MNFYKHHIGDYAQATSHLSFIEDAAYSRMIRKYYAEEKPLPADIKSVQRLVGARSKEERQAVEDVLNEFFDLQSDGWHNKRCDEELARANAQAETNKRIAEEREARKRAAKQAHDESTIRVTQQHESLNESYNESLPSREPSQTPDSRHQTPDFKTITSPVITDGEKIPVEPIEWLQHFNQQHGTNYDVKDKNVRNKVWPVLTRWCKAGYTMNKIADAWLRAQQESTEPIVNPILYVDRVLESMSRPPKKAPVNWWKSPQGIADMLKQLGMKTIPGENNEALIARINAELDKRGER